MPDIAFSCPQCEQPLEAPQDMAGETIECPACGQSIQIPAAAAPALEAQQGTPCPSCGSPLEGDSVLCLQCGYHVKLGKHIQTDLG